MEATPSKRAKTNRSRAIPKPKKQAVIKQEVTEPAEEITACTSTTEATTLIKSDQHDNWEQQSFYTAAENHAEEEEEVQPNAVLDEAQESMSKVTLLFPSSRENTSTDSPGFVQNWLSGNIYNI